MLFEYLNKAFGNMSETYAYTFLKKSAIETSLQLALRFGIVYVGPNSVMALEKLRGMNRGRNSANPFVRTK